MVPDDALHRAAEPPGAGVGRTPAVIQDRRSSPGEKGFSLATLYMRLRDLTKIIHHLPQMVRVSLSMLN